MSHSNKLFGYQLTADAAAWLVVRPISWLFFFSPPPPPPMEEPFSMVRSHSSGIIGHTCLRPSLRAQGGCCQTGALSNWLTFRFLTPTGFVSRSRTRLATTDVKWRGYRGDKLSTGGGEKRKRAIRSFYRVIFETLLLAINFL